MSLCFLKENYTVLGISTYLIEREICFYGYEVKSPFRSYVCLN